MKVSAEERAYDGGDHLRLAAPRHGVGRAEVYLAEGAYAPHRHDRYVIGFTTRGVQTFDYRGATRRAREGEAFLLHPDERHDGRPGTEAGFGYHCLYVAPREISRCLQGRPLPFLGDPVTAHPALLKAIRQALDAKVEQVEALQRHDLLCGLAWAMAEAAGPAIARRLQPDLKGMERARSLLLASLESGVAVEALEGVSGHDRWSLYRHFRALYGVSPHRYLTMRRLDRAQSLIAAGKGLAETAAACGFADQSHMTRWFRQAFGLSPGRWRKLAGPDAALGS